MEEKDLSVEIDRGYLTTWLRYLMYIQLAGIVVTVLSAVLSLGAVLGWIGQLLTAGSVLIFFRLAAVNVRYRKAAILQGIVLAGGIISALSKRNVFTLAISICAVIAQYQEYYAHGELCEERAANLAQKWRSLFVWQLVVGFVIGFISSAGAVIGVVSDAQPESIVNAVLIVSAAVSTVMEVIYLLYLKRTIALYTE